MKRNLLLDTDAYKQTHHLIYPEGTRNIVSYLEARGGESEHTLFFGLQYALKEYLTGKVVTQEMIDEAEIFCNKMFGMNYFNRKGWEYILHKYDGRLPIKIKAVPEGTVVPVHNVLMTIENTDPNVPWLTNFLETILFESIWYGTSVATLSFNIKRLIKSYAEYAGETVNPFHLNDFGFRGVSSHESAMIGGAAHLVNFLGTDTLAGIRMAMDYYNSDVCGYSVMASEHSVVTMFGRENELDAYKHFLKVCPSNTIFSSVSDTYDFKNTVDIMYGDILKNDILNREGKWVIRPDSGDPVDMSIYALRSAYEKFGGTVNERGYKVLNPRVGVIYGDGIDYNTINQILKAVVVYERFAPSNIIFGMGGALLQKVNRDTHKMAIKASLGNINGEWIPVWKETKTDTSKKSKPGRLALFKDLERGFITTTMNDPFAETIDGDCLETVFENGVLVREQNFEDIRKIAESFM